MTEPVWNTRGVKWVMQTFTIQEKQNTDSDPNKHLDL